MGGAMRLEDGDTFVLDSGETYYANRGLLSVSEDGYLFGGYDGQIEYENTPPEHRLGAEERQEIADYMIERWRKWASGGKR
jgi:hypothetical protein